MYIYTYINTIYRYNAIKVNQEQFIEEFVRKIYFHRLKSSLPFVFCNRLLKQLFVQKKMLTVTLFWLRQTSLVILGYRNEYFLVALYHLIARRQNLEIATKRFFHQHVKTLGQFQHHALTAISGGFDIAQFPEYY